MGDLTLDTTVEPWLKRGIVLTILSPVLLVLVGFAFPTHAAAVKYRTCDKRPVIVRANEFTSCGLARNVQRRLRVYSDRRISQLAGRPFRVRRVRSPVTGKRYNLRCQVGARDLLCTGRNRIWIGFAVR